MRSMLLTLILLINSSDAIEFPQTGNPKCTKKMSSNIKNADDKIIDIILYFYCIILYYILFILHFIYIFVILTYILYI